MLKVTAAATADFSQRTVIHPCSCSMKLSSSMRYAGWCVTAFRNFLSVPPTNSIRPHRNRPSYRALPRGKESHCSSRFRPVNVQPLFQILIHINVPYALKWICGWSPASAVNPQLPVTCKPPTTTTTFTSTADKCKGASSLALNCLTFDLDSWQTLWRLTQQLKQAIAPKITLRYAYIFIID